MPNRLIKEKSPYLLQHAHNPVDWYSWSEEAFKKAQKEDKPIFLSIGYSTCHWCHVMEKESFEEVSTAALLNQDFVSIKVDREELPDIDAIYMSYVIATTGHGGWPMSVFLTPDRKPFYGGTYFPPTDRYGMPGFKTLLNSITDAWKTRRSEIMNSADSAVQFLKNRQAPLVEGTLDEAVIKEAFTQALSQFDVENGGFGRAPKFPMPHLLSLLLRYSHRFHDKEALPLVEKTLQKMASGGLRDALGGGFHRYSTDARWFLPHFEKMLYDQALLVRAYLDAYQITGHALYSEVVKDTLHYVLRDMTSPEGGFYSAEDADSAESAKSSEKKEGAFYVWTQNELRENLLGEDVEIFAFRYGIHEHGNVGLDPHQEFTGKNILHEIHSLSEIATHFKKSESDIQHSLDRSRSLLLKARSKRPKPHLDDKILVDWNALMIGSFARAGRILKEPKFTEAALQAARFIETKMKNSKGEYFHRYRDGEAAIGAYLDDYAFLGEAYLDLYETTHNMEWLAQSKKIADQTIEKFWDPQLKAFFMGPEDPLLGIRPKPDHDGAVPSGSAIAALMLLKLHSVTLDARYETIARDAIEHYSVALKAHPTSYAQFLIALDYALGPSEEWLISAKKGDPKINQAMSELDSRFIPRKIVLLDSGEVAEEMKKTFPVFQDKKAKDEITFFVCRKGACELPFAGIENLKKHLEKYS